MWKPEPIPPLNDETFRLLRDLIHGYCGIYFEESGRFLLERRLARRLSLHQLPGFQDYYLLLKYGKQRDEELAAVIDLLTTNETYFFREEAGLRAFSEEIVPELRERRKQDRTLRIWSAGCSTGEEPYTLAILLLEAGSWEGWDVEILGSDINQRVLQAARRGVYHRGAFRATEPRYLKEYFEDEGDGSFRIQDRIRRWVSFSHVNLLDPARMSLVPRMDVIFCRNVIIYFDRQAKRQVVASFYQKLAEEGYLLLGHSESLINLSTDFTLRHLKHDMVYQKPFRQGVQSPMSNVQSQALENASRPAPRASSEKARGV